MTLALYVTADRIGAPTGGGAVTHHELLAMREEFGGAVKVMPEGDSNDPFSYDRSVLAGLKRVEPNIDQFKLAHFYAGTFTESVKWLRERGVKVTYTAAAHDISASRREHERLGIPYDYPHLTDPVLWEKYLGGYGHADCLIVPSEHSATVMRGFGCTNKIAIIHHGCHLPEKVAFRRERGGIKFTIGYLGAVGPDKGLIHLLMAWARLLATDPHMRDKMRLVLAGAHSQSEFVSWLMRLAGLSDADVVRLGWVDSVSDFYQSLDLYVQPSVTEGFGIEVLEAMAHGVPTIASTGVGASCLLPGSCHFPPADHAALADHILKGYHILQEFRHRRSWSDSAAATAEWYSWDRIRGEYRRLWRSLL